jgi:hypothetical protein
MKKVLSSLVAGLFVAAAAGFLLARSPRTANSQAHRPEPDHESDVLAETERTAEEMLDAFVPNNVNTRESLPALLDLNSCSLQDLLAIGELEADWAVRIVESRPYRNKMDLLSRLVIPIDVFNAISERVSIAKPEEGVKIA